MNVLTELPDVRSSDRVCQGDQREQCMILLMSNWAICGATTYEEQRRVRLTDAIFDYLSDDDVTAQQTYDDLINTIKEDASYYKKHYDRCRDLLFKMGYYGSIEDDVLVKDGIAYSESADEGVLKLVTPNSTI